MGRTILSCFYDLGAATISSSYSLKAKGFGGRGINAIDIENDWIMVRCGGREMVDRGFGKSGTPFSIGESSVEPFFNVGKI